MQAVGEKAVVVDGDVDNAPAVGGLDGLDGLESLSGPDVDDRAERGLTRGDQFLSILA